MTPLQTHASYCHLIISPFIAEMQYVETGGTYSNRTNSVQLSSNQEAISCAATQEIPSILCNPKFNAAFTKALHLSLS
jgi:hypothetical protein